MSNQITINDIIPKDVLFLIFDYVPVINWANVSLTCKYWNNTSKIIYNKTYSDKLNTFQEQLKYVKTLYGMLIIEDIPNNEDLVNMEQLPIDSLNDELYPEILYMFSEDTYLYNPEFNTVLNIVLIQIKNGLKNYTDNYKVFLCSVDIYEKDDYVLENWKPTEVDAWILE